MLSPSASPIEVVRRLFTAIDDERWMDAADCIEPAEIQSQYDKARRALHGDAHQCVVDVVTVGTAGAQAAPSARAPQLKFQGRAAPSVTVVTAGIRSVAELEKITPEELMARLVAQAIGNPDRPAKESQGATDFRARRAEQGAAESEDAGSSSPVTERIFRVAIGETYETDELAHVVYRRLIQRGERTQLLEPIRVVTLGRTPSGWRTPGPAYEHIRPKGPRLLSRGADRFEPAWL